MYTHLHEEEALLPGSTDEHTGVMSVHSEWLLTEDRLLGFKHAEDCGSMLWVEVSYIHHINLYIHSKEKVRTEKLLSRFTPHLSTVHTEGGPQKFETFIIQKAIYIVLQSTSHETTYFPGERKVDLYSQHRQEKLLCVCPHSIDYDHIHQPPENPPLHI